MSADRQMSSERQARVAVVIPCYRVGDGLAGLLQRIGPEVDLIVVVDDACPDDSAARALADQPEPRTLLVRHASNQGVGGATASGYRAALAAGAEVVVKLDGDGQMDPALIPALIEPILSGRADYTKGNRFHRLSYLRGMPRIRLAGNAALSFMAKASSGYWQLFDPTNGFTAIHAAVLAEIELDRMARRYFFESDLLYHLNQLRAVVVELPMSARYADEHSSLSPLRVAPGFAWGHLRNLTRRIGYSYFVRGFSLATVELMLALPLILFGLGFGIEHWIHSVRSGEAASAGTVMLSALPILLGSQLLLSWLNFDVASEPRTPLHPMLTRVPRSRRQDA